MGEREKQEGRGRERVRAGKRKRNSTRHFRKEGKRSVERKRIENRETKQKRWKQQCRDRKRENG